MSANHEFTANLYNFAAKKNSQNRTLNLTNASLIFNDFTAKVLIFSAKELSFAAQVKKRWNQLQGFCSENVKGKCNETQIQVPLQLTKFQSSEQILKIFYSRTSRAASLQWIRKFTWIIDFLNAWHLRAWPLILYLLIFRTMVLTARRAVIQARVTRKPRYTGVHSNPQPRLMMPRSAWHANVWGRT